MKYFEYGIIRVFYSCDCLVFERLETQKKWLLMIILATFLNKFY
jgi:hypothetical protein